MKPYFAYIRVSTVKQGERGSSLQEQKSSIEAHAQRHGLAIVAWFEEMETAAKQGRREFSRMLTELQRGTASGLIIHKIDRSARNLRDWANLGELIDRGIDVQFAHDGLDLHTRGGRLSADIQAVVAADYVRNLRDEVKKGFYGRLKQGLYPLPAPIGYLDKGGGRPKELDPIRAPLVRHAFERYATASYSLKKLCMELHQLGLRSRVGLPLRINTLSGMLHNPFYVGLIRIGRTGETFQGIHAPLVTQIVFDRVQAVLRGKTAAKTVKHDFLFRRQIRCERCGHLLTGERQKQRFVYYRCHSDGCPSTTVTEEALDNILREKLMFLRCDEEEIRDIRDMIEAMRENVTTDVERQHAELRMRLAKCEERLHRLTDALIDGLLDKELFESRKVAILSERRDLRDRLEAPPSALSATDRVSNYFERQNKAYVGYESDSPLEKRAIVEDLISNLSVRGKKPTITLKSPFQEIVNWRFLQDGGPCRDDVRTRARQLLEVLKSCADRQMNDTVVALNRPA